MIPPSAPSARSIAFDVPSRAMQIVNASMDAWRTRHLVLIGFSRSEPPVDKRRRNRPHAAAVFLGRVDPTVTLEGVMGTAT